ncbi:hypothetical protein [Serinicoccus marinus]|uniref:hypothetical protein n=1 Tax=Serinicoccus marinus TaxID=247333 RepID=UPI00122E54E8|nr:hypothetical protein [Serinicoccus marinus]
MRFSEHFNITRSGDETWFDPLLDQDTPLYVDPFLVFDDKKKRWKSARSDVVDFFEVAAQLVSAAGSAKATAAYSKATSFLRFPEPNEFALGVSMGRPNGSGTGGGFADDMATVLQLVHKHSDVAHLATIQGFDLFSTGIGFDRISDILCNILKARFIDYTQKVAKKHGVPMEPVMVKHASWSKSNARWENKKVMLPKSPTRGWRATRTRTVLARHARSHEGRLLPLGRCQRRGRPSERLRLPHHGRVEPADAAMDRSEVRGEASRHSDGLHQACRATAPPAIRRRSRSPGARFLA